MKLDKLNLPYKILTGKDPLLEEHMTPEIASILTSIEPELDGGQQIIDRLNKLILKHPQVVYLRDMLIMAHYYNDDIENMKSTAQKLHEENPNFLHARAKLAQIAMMEERFDKALEYLGKDLKLEALYPDQKEFFLNEVMTYNHVVFEYLWQLGRKEEAFERFTLLRSLDANHHTTISAMELMATHLRDRISTRMSPINMTMLSQEKSSRVRKKLGAMNLVLAVAEKSTRNVA